MSSYREMYFSPKVTDRLHDIHTVLSASERGRLDLEVPSFCCVIQGDNQGPQPITSQIENTSADRQKLLDVQMPFRSYTRYPRFPWVLDDICIQNVYCHACGTAPEMAMSVVPPLWSRGKYLGNNGMDPSSFSDLLIGKCYIFKDKCKLWFHLNFLTKPIYTGNRCIVLEWNFLSSVHPPHITLWE